MKRMRSCGASRPGCFAFGDFAAAARNPHRLVLLPVDVLTAGLDDFAAVELRGDGNLRGWMATFLLLL
jgi:hypothetical protein